MNQEDKPTSSATDTSHKGDKPQKNLLSPWVNTYDSSPKSLSGFSYVAMSVLLVASLLLWVSLFVTEMGPGLFMALSILINVVFFVVFRGVFGAVKEASEYKKGIRGDVELGGRGLFVSGPIDNVIGVSIGDQNKVSKERQRRQQPVYSSIQSTHKRIRTTNESEIIKLSGFGAANAVMGGAFIAIGVALSVWLSIDSTVLDMGSIIARISISVVLTATGFVLLGVYKKTRSDIRHMHNELTNIDAIYSAVFYACEHYPPEVSREFVLKLASTERNFLIPKDHSTLATERFRVESEMWNALASSVPGAIGAVAGAKQAAAAKVAGAKSAKQDMNAPQPSPEVVQLRAEMQALKALIQDVALAAQGHNPETAAQQGAARSTASSAAATQDAMASEVDEAEETVVQIRATQTGATQDASANQVQGSQEGTQTVQAHATEADMEALDPRLPPE